MFFSFFYTPECELCKKPTGTISHIFCPECFDKINILANKGDSNAQMLIGRYYSSAAEEDKSFAKKAIQYYELSANQGNMYAQRFLGACFVDGFGVEKNYDEAIKWYRKSAEQGHEPAQYALGVLLMEQNKDCKESLRWLEKSAAQGNHDAFNLVSSLKN